MPCWGVIRVAGPVDSAMGLVAACGVGVGGVDRASVGDSAFVSFDSIALPSVGGLECEHSLLSLRECVLGTVRSTVVPAFPSPVERVVEWESGCSKWE